MSDQKLVFQTGTWAGKHTAPLHKTLQNTVELHTVLSDKLDGIQANWKFYSFLAAAQGAVQLQITVPFVGVTFWLG